MQTFSFTCFQNIHMLSLFETVYTCHEYV